MGKIIVEQIVSADGYAEDADGGIGFFANADWINAADTEQLRMLSEVSAIVLGANTYRMFAGYWPSADPVAEPVAVPISELPKFVVSTTLDAAPWGSDNSAEILKGDGVAAVRELRKRFAGNIIIWGSLTLSDALFRAGEVDVLRLRILPILIGSGRSFAPPDLGLRKLSLANTQSFSGGLIVSEYHLAYS
ncbi:MAG: reductase [Gammaproteobacteria bacterium]|nr:MAG: reductase [Gammaproteobacteria bacterium]